MKMRNCILGIIALLCSQLPSPAFAISGRPVMFPTSQVVGGLVNVELTGGGIGQFPAGSTATVTVGNTTAEVTDFNPSSGSIYFRAPEIRGGYVDVVVSGKSYDLGMLDITFNEQGRYITRVDPVLVVPGATVMVIKGAGFGDHAFDSAVYFGDVRISQFTFWSQSEIRFVAPFGIKTGDTVKVQRFFLDPAGGFMVDQTVHVIKPVIFQLRSAGTLAESVYGGDVVTVLGSGFDFAAGKQEIYWGSARIYPNDASGTSFTFVAPPLVGTFPLNLVVTLDNGTKETIQSSTQLTINGAASNDEFSRYQNYLLQIGVPAAWQVTTGSRSVIVAVIDSGVSTNHPDLTNRIWTNSGEIIGNNKDDDNNGYVDDVHGYDFVNDRGYMVPTSDHGTLVAGIIAAEKDNGVFLAGISPDVQVMPLIVFPAVGGADSKNIADAIRYAVDNGADIINLSLGGPFSTALDAAIKYAYEKNVVVVAAAGNTDELGTFGYNLDLNPLSPVCNDNGKNIVLGVASVTAKDEPSTDFTSYGKCVDVSAPGEDVLSLTDAHGWKIAIESGTSFAAPMVTGVAALLKSAYPSLTNREIMDVIMATADPLQNVPSIYAGKLGAGRVNAGKALMNAYVKAAAVVTPTTLQAATTSSTSDLSQRLRGYILLQVESLGEAWYVNPDTGKRAYMRDGTVAYQMMRNYGLGISNADLAGIPAADTTDEMKASTSVCAMNDLAHRVRGKILLQVQSLGEAWYVDPVKCRRIYMKNGDAAYAIMRFLSLGISNNDLAGISTESAAGL